MNDNGKKYLMIFVGVVLGMILLTAVIKGCVKPYDENAVVAVEQVDR